ncbi:MAG: energy transducer TonB [Blastocatellia bacterium]
MREAVLSLPAFSDQPSLIKRLAFESIEAVRELRANPKQYLAVAIRGDASGGYRRKALFRFGLAIGIVLYSILFGVTLVLWSVNTRHAGVPPKSDISFIGTPLNTLIAMLPQSDKEAHGGGGGGREAHSPATDGAPPPFAPENPIMAPTTRPTIEPPALPQIERLLGDPAHNLRRDESIPAGLLDGVIAPPSDGPGSKGGIGSGINGGVGPGVDAGFGPGNHGGEGGGDYNGPGGRSGGDVVTAADTKPVALNLPRPNYTEEARKNKIQGTVRARVLVGSDGLVKQVTIVRGLPEGLNEEAIRAAFQIRFRPATRSGRTVPYWTTLEVDFNIR